MLLRLLDRYLLREILVSFAAAAAVLLMVTFGGSLVDVEGETQNRTPGLASVPLLGNLFKRRATTRNTDEILFFITPRIYRSDYHGRPMAGTVGTSTRIVTIPQPVPLGNPETNTPTPTPQSSVQPLSPQLQSVPFTNEQPLTSQPAARP